MVACETRMLTSQAEQDGTEAAVETRTLAPTTATKGSSSTVGRRKNSASTDSSPTEVATSDQGVEVIDLTSETPRSKPRTTRKHSLPPLQSRKPKRSKTSIFVDDEAGVSGDEEDNEDDVQGDTDEFEHFIDDTPIVNRTAKPKKIVPLKKRALSSTEIERLIEGTEKSQAPAPKPAVRPKWATAATEQREPATASTSKSNIVDARLPSPHDFSTVAAKTSATSTGLRPRWTTEPSAKPPSPTSRPAQTTNHELENDDDILNELLRF